MKAGRAFGCLFWALLYCVLYLDLVNASEDELLDFDFAEAKDADATSAIEDWQLEDDSQSQQQSDKKQQLENNMLDFSVDLDEPEPEKQLPPFDWREKVLRSALAKALTDRVLRQRFAEVMPILRVLSSQQRLALSALISAQMNAKQGHELKLEQVRMMFGNDRKLILPVVYDLANLVKNSARKYINLSSDLAVASLKQPTLQQRKDELSAEESAQDDSVGTIDVADKSEEAATVATSLEDFFEEMQSEVLDAQMINEALQPVKPTAAAAAVQLPQRQRRRLRRSANEFVHKLTRSVPVSVTEQQLLGGAAGRTIRLNTTAFQQSHAAATQPTVASTLQPSLSPSYEEVENLAFAGLNGTELPLNADERLYQLSAGNNSSAEEELLPNPEELIAGPRYRLNNQQRPNQKLAPIKRKRVQQQQQQQPPAVYGGRGRPKASASSHNPVVAPPQHKKCERFTSNMCIRTDDYPLEQIMGSIRRHKNAMSALLAEFYDKPNNNLEFGDDFDDYILNKKRREDEGSAGGMCQSVVRYARPQKAKAASGEWKFIVNTGQHTQTLRLEKCSNPGESCSYLAQTYRSHCSQVYNYHRLLSWDKVRGLHVDIFKVPTCCSCQVDGYRQQFPPLSSIQPKEYTTGGSSYKLLDNGNSNGYSTINEEDLDYNDASDEDELGLSYAPFHTRETNELSYLGSKKVRSKLPPPASVGPYLSPPDDEDQFDQISVSYKRPSSSASSIGSASSSSKKYYSQLSRRRPQHTESRVDMELDLSPSETQAEQEVNVFGPPGVPLKRKRIYTSTTHTATTTGGATRLRIPVSVSKPQTTTTAAAAAAAATRSSNILPARTGSAASVVSSAAHAHQAAASASGQAASSNIALGAGQRYYAAVGKSRPRFYAPIIKPTTSTVSAAAAASAATSSTIAATPVPTPYHVHQSTAFPQQPAHVNSIYSESSNSNNVNSNSNNNNNTRRINYSYHPIIDFFEQRREATQTEEQDSAGQESRIVSSMATPSNVGNNVFQHAIPTSHERRIGLGGAGVAGGAGQYGYANDNAWQPLVVAH